MAEPEPGQVKSLPGVSAEDTASLADITKAITRLDTVPQPDKSPPTPIPAENVPSAAVPTRKPPEMPESVPSVEGAEAPEEPETPVEEPSEEPPEEEGQELPSRLEEVAEALGLTWEDFTQVEVPIRVNGEDRHVSLADALQGQQFEADYRQKTAALATDRRTLETERTEGRQQMQTRLQQAEDLLTVLSQDLAQEASGVELDKLLEEQGTEEYLKQKARQDRRKEQLQGAMQQLAYQRQQKLAQDRQNAQKQLLGIMPELSDAKARDVFHRGLYEYLGRRDFAGTEIVQFFDGPFDPRHIRVLADAAKYDAMVEAQKQTTRKPKVVPTVAKPGAATGKPQATADKKTALKERLKKAKWGPRKQQDKAALAFIRQLDALQ